MRIRNRYFILTASLAVLTLGITSCGLDDSGSAAEPAQSPASSPAAKETGDSGQSSAIDLHRTDSAPGDSEPDPEPTPLSESAGPPAESSGDSEPTRARFALSIDDPDAEPCPYGAKVAQVEGHVEQFNRALDLGCYMDIHGVIEFTEPVVTDQWGNTTDTFRDHSQALSADELCEKGYISAEECEAEDRRW